MGIFFFLFTIWNRLIYARSIQWWTQNHRLMPMCTILCCKTPWNIRNANNSLSMHSIQILLWWRCVCYRLYICKCMKHSPLGCSWCYRTCFVAHGWVSFFATHCALFTSCLDHCGLRQVLRPSFCPAHWGCAGFGFCFGYFAIIF